MERIRKCVELCPCDLLVIHRDAEGETRETRENEIRAAMNSLGDIEVPFVCVVPVRMQEAWLLVDENAIRQAAGNPRGRDTLTMPRLNEVERLPDPLEASKQPPTRGLWLESGAKAITASTSGTGRRVNR